MVALKLLSMNYAPSPETSTPRAKRVVLHARAVRNRVFAAAIVALRGTDEAPRFTWGQLAMWLDCDYRDAWVIGHGGKATAKQLERVLAIVGKRAA